MQAYPLRFEPVIKQTIWGGRRLGEVLGKPIGEEADYAESWEVVDHGDDQSVVADGPLQGQTLAGVMNEHRGWLLGSESLDTSFPLLLKYLDCNRVLSVQVHPSDAYGLKMDPPDLGKTEAWYIVAAEPDSLIYAGLKQGVDRTALERAIADGVTEDALHSFHPSRGDVVFIPAGTVHALGEGLLVAEIQQSSDTTFRLYDWNRLGADGKARPLHLTQGLEVTDFATGPISPLRSDPSLPGWQPLVQCDKFVLRSLETGDATVGGEGRFDILTVPRGSAELNWAGGSLVASAGTSLLLPASMERAQLSVAPESVVLSARLP